jgi:NADP-dependent 3-hydroxy acid dehydrogenase YdfG
MNGARSGMGRGFRSHYLAKAAHCNLGRNDANDGQENLFITGTNSGFGRAIALAAAQADHSVIGTVRSEAAVAEIEAAGRDRIHALVLDVTSSQAIPPAVEEAEAKFGQVDVLINNAGWPRGDLGRVSARRDAPAV